MERKYRSDGSSMKNSSGTLNKNGRLIGSVTFYSENTAIMRGGSNVFVTKGYGEDGVNGCFALLKENPYGIRIRIGLRVCY